MEDSSQVLSDELKLQEWKKLGHLGLNDRRRDPSTLLYTTFFILTALSFIGCLFY